MNRRDFLKHSAAAGEVVWTRARIGPAEKPDQNQSSDDAPVSQWIRPGAEDKRPVWGIHGGIQVGLWPASVEGPGTGGPRGLLRIGYPVIDGGRSIGLINFIAVEPIVDGRRGYSELEQSESDRKQGRLFWTGDTPQTSTPPDPGTLSSLDGVERLSVRVHTERFSNGAQPTVDFEFRADRPGELRLTTTSVPGSARMEYCVLTATMGNYSRLRLLWLRDGVIRSGKVWPDFTGNEFTPDAFFRRENFLLPRKSVVLGL